MIFDLVFAIFMYHQKKTQASRVTAPVSLKFRLGFDWTTGYAIG